MALAKLKSLGLSKVSVKLAKKMKENKKLSFSKQNVKSPNLSKLKKYDLKKILKTFKIPKAKKIVMLKAKTKK